jgi:hypothetical protein
VTLTLFSIPVIHKHMGIIVCLFFFISFYTIHSPRVVSSTLPSLAVIVAPPGRRAFLPKFVYNEYATTNLTRATECIILKHARTPNILWEGIIRTGFSGRTNRSSWQAFSTKVPCERPRRRNRTPTTCKTRLKTHTAHRTCTVGSIVGTITGKKTIPYRIAIRDDDGIRAR